MNGQDSFWKWFGIKLSNGTKDFFKTGGWTIIPMTLQTIILGIIGAIVWIPTGFLWLIPCAITMAYDYWKDIVKKDCRG